MLEEPERIYNLNVEEFHTYFVGTNGLLVHNDCTPEMIGAARDAIAYAKKRGIDNVDELAKIGQDAADAMGRAIENNIFLAKQHGITDPVELEKIAQEAANLQRIEYGNVRGMFTRTQEELDSLALDPANNTIKLWERDAVLGCEAGGQIPGPLVRSADPKAELY